MPEQQDTTQPARVVRLPGFSADQAVGVGDVVKRVTSRIGAKPCGGCERRAQWLNERLVFRGRQSS